MSAIIALTPGSQMPAYLRKENRTALAAINADVVHGPSFPILSIKGKVFTLVKGSERKIMTRADDPDEVLQFLHLTPVRANTKSRVFYANAYVEGSEDIQRPDCYSSDGITPGADSRNIQSPKCATCPHAVWGSKVSPGYEGKGTACTVNTRLAVVDPEQAAVADEIEPYLLRVPAGSRSNFADVVKTAESRGIPYNALVLKVGFDKEAPSPKLTFKIVGLANDAVYEKVSAAYDGEMVKDMMGLGPVRAALPAPAQATATATEDDLEAALAARNAAQAAAVAKPKPAPAAAAEASAEDLDALLGGGAPAEESAAPAPAPAPAPAKVRATAPAKPKAPPAPPPAPAPAPVQAAAQATADDLGGLLGDLDGLLGSIDD